MPVYGAGAQSNSKQGALLISSLREDDCDGVNWHEPFKLGTLDLFFQLLCIAQAEGIKSFRNAPFK